MDFEAIICRECPTPIQWEVLRRHYVRGVNAAIWQRDARIATLEAELLRVRTTGHGAAHELDNIAVECGLGHSPKPGDVAAHVRQLREAVMVLANEVRECFVIFGRMKPSDMVDHLHPNTKANPIASAAITDAAKAREGA